MAPQEGGWLSSVRIPQMDGAILHLRSARGSETTAVGAPDHSAVRVDGQGREQLPRGRLPELDRLVRTGTGQPSAIGAPTHHSQAGMPVQGEQTLLSQAAQIIPLPAAPIRFVPLRPPVLEQFADASQPARSIRRLGGQVHLRVVEGLLQIVAGPIGFAAGLVGLGFFVECPGFVGESPKGEEGCHADTGQQCQRHRGHQPGHRGVALTPARQPFRPTNPPRPDRLAGQEAP
jgi:hypothetical protein